MRGVVIREFGPIETHKLEEVPAPTPGDEEVLITVHAIGVNFPDTLMMQGQYQKKPARPFVPGRDIAGVVAAVGKKVTRCKVGDRVVSLVWWGGYAEQAVAPQSRVFHMPEGLDYVTAAGMFTVFNTAYVSLVVRGLYQPGETVLVNGAGGGVGSSCVQVAKAKGATVIAGDITEAKRQLAKENGADSTIDLSMGDLNENLRQQVFALTNGRGVDIVLDPVGGDVFDASLRALAFAGRIVTIGYTSGRLPVVKANYLNVKNLSAVGVALDLHFDHAPQTMEKVVADLFDMYVKGKIRPKITATYPLAEFQKPLMLLHQGKAMGKMVLTVR